MTAADNVIDTLTERNEAFAAGVFSADLRIIPSMKVMLIGCVDPRVDPVEVLGLGLGEAAVVRNVGGRITPDTIETLAMLDVVARAGGGRLGAGWNLIVLHHTDCGITRLHDSPELLTQYFGVDADALDDLAIDDPRASVAVDIAALRADTRVPGGFIVSGLVYDVSSGLVEVVVAPGELRSETTN